MITRLPHHTDPSCPLVLRLQREWDALGHRPTVVHRARSWGLGFPFSSLDEVLIATGHRPGAPNALVELPGGAAAFVAAVLPANEVVARLLLAARTDELAARVLLQRLLPGLLSAARRWRRRHGNATDAFDEVVAAAWTVLREFPVERRPSHLVSNLLRDAEYRAFIRPRRRLAVHEPVATHLLDHSLEHVDVEPLRELAEVVACTSTLTEQDHALLRLLLDGRTTLEVAAELQVSERTVRTHRAAMVGRMREAVAA